MNHPKRVFRNPEKLAQVRTMQEEQRQAFIEPHGADLIVVPGVQVQPTLIAFYHYIYEQAESTNGPWTEPDLPPLPTEWTTADTVAMIYDHEDGLGFYVDFAAAQQAFADPNLVRRRRYREVISDYLRGQGVSRLTCWASRTEKWQTLPRRSSSDDTDLGRTHVVLGLRLLTSATRPARSTSRPSSHPLTKPS